MNTKKKKSIGSQRTAPDPCAPDSNLGLTKKSAITAFNPHPPLSRSQARGLRTLFAEMDADVQAIKNEIRKLRTLVCRYIRHLSAAEMYEIMKGGIKYAASH